MIRLLRLFRDRRGVAATEFALLSSLFLVFTLVSLDMGTFLMKRSQLSNALDSAALASFAQRTNVNFTGLPTFVTQASRMSGTTVTVGCNGGTGNCVNTNRTCACLTKTATFVAATCGATCTGAVTANSVAGYYMTISASASHTPVIMPGRLFDTLPTSQKITVRLQ